MGFSSVRSPASSRPPAPPAPAQAPFASSSAATANPPAKSFRQVLDESAKTDKKPGAVQTAPKAITTKKQTNDTDADADPAANVDGSGAAAGEESQAVVAQGAGKAAAVKVKAPNEAQNGGADTGDDAKPQMANVDAGQIEAVDEEKDSDPSEKKEAPAEKSKAKPTTSSSDLAAAAGSTVVSEVNPVQMAALKSEVAQTPVSTSIEKETGSKAAEKGSKAPQLKAEEATGPSKAKSGDSAKPSVSAGTNDNVSSADDAAAIAGTAAAQVVAAPKTANQTSSSDNFAAAVQQASDAAQKAAVAEKSVAAQPAAPPLPAEAQFAATNSPQIVSAVHTQLLPNGGSMHIRLDPPELGALQITVRMRDGMMTAEFQASSDQAAKLLSHSLGDLKSQLEAQGVSIEKLHVTQSARTDSGGKSDSGDSSRRDGSPTEQQLRDQQRREMLRRMWSKVAGEQFPLDMVA